MKLTYLILVTIAALSGCVKKNMSTAAPIDQPRKDTVKVSVGDSLTYLALGDSYTIGESVAAPLSYPYQLVAQLKANNYPVATPKIIATTGWTTDNLIAAIAKSNVTTKKYDLVTLLIGVNDQFQGLSQENYKIKFAQVLNTAIAFANNNKNRVFVISIPDYGVTPFAEGNDAVIGPQIDQFNAINEAESVGAGVNYVDITAISRQAASNPMLIAFDGLHPSGTMYTLWINELLPRVIANLK